MQDVTLPEYIGQKLELTWKLREGSADATTLTAQGGQTGGTYQQTARRQL